MEFKNTEEELNFYKTKYDKINKWKQENKAYYQDYNKKYYLDRKEDFKKLYENNKEELKNKSLNWYYQNRDLIKQKYQDNKEEINERNKKRHQEKEKIECNICGRSYKNITSHNKTKLHENNLNN